MKKLIIVCEEKYRVYGDYLAQLISMEDDTDEKMIGVKDGAAAAQVWMEKDYNANASQLSSNQYILFMGNDKLVKEKSSHMHNEFQQFGMEYGWLGRQAYLSVIKVVPTKEYDDFIAFALNYQDNLEKYIKEKDFSKTTNNKFPESAVLAAIGEAFAVVPMIGKGLVKKLALDNNIEEQQYNCVVMKFYLDALQKFLGL